MSISTARTHTFTSPPAGHVDGPNACTDCGYGPAAPWHGQPGAGLVGLFEALDVADRAVEAATETARRVTLARTTAVDLRAQLSTLTGQDGKVDTALAWADGAIARIVAALDGETRPEALRFQGIVLLKPAPPAEPATTTVEQLPDQLALDARAS